MAIVERLQKYKKSVSMSTSMKLMVNVLYLEVFSWISILVLETQYRVVVLDSYFILIFLFMESIVLETIMLKDIMEKAINILNSLWI